MSDTTTSLDDTSHTVDSLALKTRDLELTANSFSRAMTQAFAVSVTGGKQFDDVLKSLTLRLSNLSVNLAFRPVQNSISGGIDSLLSGLTGTSSGGRCGQTVRIGRGDRRADLFPADAGWRGTRR